MLTIERKDDPYWDILELFIDKESAQIIENPDMDEQPIICCA